MTENNAFIVLKVSLLIGWVRLSANTGLMRTQRTAFARVYALIPRSFARWSRRCKVETALKLAPAVGFEPTTNRLTADRSTTELRWNSFCQMAGIQFVHRMNSGKSFPNRRGDLVAGAGFEPAIPQSRGL